MRYYKPNNATILYLNSSFNCVKTNSITLTKTTGGSGYISAPSINIIQANGDSGGGCAATCTIVGGSIDTITVTNNGLGYTKLPSITVSGGGNLNSVSGYSSFVGGSGYLLPPTISLTGGGGGTDFIATATLTPTTVSPTFTITNGGTGYITGDVIVFDNSVSGGSGAIATVVATSGIITGITLTNGGSYTLRPPYVNNIISTVGKGAIITCNLVATSVGSIVITNGGKNFSTLPTIVFTPVSGGTGASAIATVNFGVDATITASFLKTYSYTWNIPDLVINDLARLSTINIIATNFTNTTPYIYRIQGLQYDSRNSFFSDFNSPILAIAQNTNVCSFGSLGGTPFSLIVSSQTIKQIVITVDDSITTIGTGQATTINFIIALEIEEFNPEFEEKTDPYQEAKSRIKAF